MIGYVAPLDPSSTFKPVENFLHELVQSANPTTLRFDWAAMDAAKGGFVESDAYIFVLQLLRTGWYGVLPSLGITHDEIEDAIKSGPKPWQELMHALYQHSDDILGAIRIGMPFIGAGVAIDIAALRMVIIGATAEAAFGTIAHETYVARFQVQQGTRTLEDAEDDASNVRMLWDAMLRLYNAGALDALKVKSTKGLGISQIATIVLGVVISVALLGVIIYGYRQQSFAHDVQLRTCFQPPDYTKKIEPWPVECKAMFEKMDTDPWAALKAFLSPLTDLTKPAGIGIGLAIVVAAAIYVGGVYVLPALVSKGVVGGGRRLLPAGG